MIERRQPAREVERVLLDNRTGKRQAEVLGYMRQGRYQHRGIVAWDLQPFADVDVPATAIVAV